MEDVSKALEFKTNIYLATLYQVVVALFVLWLTRGVFVLCNQSSTDVGSLGEYLLLSWHGLRFDLTAVAYFNSLFILLRIIPFGFTTHRVYLKVTDWVYYITNSIMIMANLGDVIYYRFSGVRMRWSGLNEIAADNNIGGIILGYAATYWWIVILAVLLIAGMIWLYGRVRIVSTRLLGVPLAAMRIALFLLLGGLTFLAMRGRTGRGNPLNIADATWHTRSARQINVVLNTPFTLLRSIGKGMEIEKMTFFSDSDLAGLRSSLHAGSEGELRRKNVMMIIIESGGASFIDSLDLFDDGSDEMKGLMPFLDSLVNESVVKDHFMATGRSSIGGANSLLASFPAFEPFSLMLSPYNAMPFDSPANLLKREGYSTAFYYGCNHGSFNVDQLGHASGFERVLDRESYDGPREDYDGTWGIFDGPMGQFVVRDLTSTPQPWFASWFTISSHSPHAIPEKENISSYRYKEPSAHRGLEYTDRAIRSFFESASKQSWYKNTIFIITGDHGNRDLAAGSHYDTSYIRFHLPLIIYTPDGSLEPKRLSGMTATQFDIAPTIMTLLNYPKSYVAVGTDIFDETKENYGISFIDNRYMLSSPDRIVFADSGLKGIETVYDAITDPELKSPMEKEFWGDKPVKMLQWARAFMQDYSYRINTGRLTIEEAGK